MVEGKNGKFVFFFSLFSFKQEPSFKAILYVHFKEGRRGPFCSADHLEFQFAVNGTKHIHFLPFYFTFKCKSECTFKCKAEIKLVVLAQLGEGQQLPPVLQGLC